MRDQPGRSDTLDAIVAYFNDFQFDPSANSSSDERTPSSFLPNSDAVDEEMSNINNNNSELSIVGGKVESTIYEKKMALYLYIPPNSAHPPGVSVGLVMGQVLRIFQLCTRESDIDSKLDAFMNQLLDRGHQHSTLLPIFKKAISNAITYLSKSKEEIAAAKLEKAEAAKRRVYLHIPYHPNNPPPSTIQRHWRHCVAEPPGELPLNKMRNKEGQEVPVDQMIIAHHRAPNLGNLLSYRKIAHREGPKVSSFHKD